MRKDPDLWHIDPQDASRLQDVRVDPHYVAHVTDRSLWQIHTLLMNRSAVTDGDFETVATSSDENRQGEWILIDLGAVCHFQNVRQLHPPHAGQPPRYRVDVADQRGFPYSLQFVGTGQPNVSTATFPRPVDARFVRITIVDDSDSPWSVAELQVD